MYVDSSGGPDVQPAGRDEPARSDREDGRRTYFEITTKDIPALLNGRVGEDAAQRNRVDGRDLEDTAQRGEQRAQRVAVGMPASALRAAASTRCAASLTKTRAAAS